MTPGKFRHLGRTSTAAGHFCILAIDHRANLREVLGDISDEEFRDFKQQVVEAATEQVSAVLTDPAFGLGPLVASGYRGGLLAPLEVTDYGVHPSQRELNWIPHWSVAKIKKMGADGVKLLLPFHPLLPTAEAKLETVRQLVADCRDADIPLFLEPIACSLSPGERLSGTDQRQVTVAMARTFCELGADILKLQLPAPEEEWEPTCRQLSQVCSVPWTLLSGGVDFISYCRQAEMACACGASGVIVGRAVWNEAARLRGEERSGFLRDVVPQRLHMLGEICSRQATSWTSRVTRPSVALDWYESY